MHLPIVVSQICDLLFQVIHLFDQLPQPAAGIALVVIGGCLFQALGNSRILKTRRW